MRLHYFKHNETNEVGLFAEVSHPQIMGLEYLGSQDIFFVKLPSVQGGTITQPAIAGNAGAEFVMPRDQYENLLIATLRKRVQELEERNDDQMVLIQEQKAAINSQSDTLKLVRERRDRWRSRAQSINTKLIDTLRRKLVSNHSQRLNGLKRIVKLETKLVNANLANDQMCDELVAQKEAVQALTSQNLRLGDKLGGARSVADKHLETIATVFNIATNGGTGWQERCKQISDLLMEYR